MELVLTNNNYTMLDYTMKIYVFDPSGLYFVLQFLFGLFDYLTFYLICEFSCLSLAYGFKSQTNTYKNIYNAQMSCTAPSLESGNKHVVHHF